MELLLNPSVSYVLLVLGFITAILALFSPGTGFLELGAIAALLLAGYGAANLPINEWAFVVMALSIVPFGLAFIAQRKRTLTQRTFLLTLSSLVFLLGAALLFRGKTWLPAVNPLLILFLTPVTVGLTWLMAKKSLEAAHAQPVFDLDRVIGMTGQVTSDIRGQGTIYLNGEEWTARSRVFIPAGCTVRVLRRDGLALEVEPSKS